MAANNEVGVIQPFEAAARAAHAVGAAILIDATQAAGWVAINQAELQADYLVLSAHKIYGPKGVGALIGPDVGAVEPRADSHVSTPNTPGIVGMGEACRLRRLEKGDDGTRVAALRDRLQDRLVAGIPGLVVNGDLSLRLPYSLHISVPYVPNDVMVDNLLDTVALSTGAACMSGVDAPSHVLSAMRLEDWRVAGALRLSLGRSTTLAEVDSAADAIVAVVARLTPLFRNAA
jgi:cysteine desulfurase